MFVSASRSISLDTKKVFWGGLHCSGLTAWWYVACWDPSCDAEESESFTTLFFPTVQCTTTRALSSIGQLPWWTVNYFWMVFSHKQNKKCRWYFAKYFFDRFKKKSAKIYDNKNLPTLSQRKSIVRDITWKVAGKTWYYAEYFM